MHAPQSANATTSNNRCRSHRPTLLLAGFLLSLGCSGFAAAQEQPADDPATQEINPLALKQRMIRDRFQRFEDRVYRLAEQLSESEPENAARLQRVLERAGELGLSDKLESVIDLLERDASLNDAMDAQRAWLDQADKLLSILLERNSDSEVRKDEMERLAEYKKTLDRVLTEQKVLRDATAQAALNERMRAQLDQAIQRLDAIQKNQDALSNEMDKASQGTTPQDQAAQKQVGDQQEDLADQSEQLRDDLERLAELEPDERSDSPQHQAAREAAKAASQSIQNAAQSMKQAGEQAKSAQGPSASQSQQSAEQSLQEAREKLEAAKKALEEQKEPSAQAQDQRDIADTTKKLAEQMRQESAAGKQGGQQGKPSSGKQTPGTESLDRAQQDMDGASESLDQQEPEQAVPQQDKAIAELEQAQQELEKALNQLRKEERAETLRDLEHRFREMLSKQRTINEETIVLNRVDPAKFTRIERLQAADLADRESTLSREAATCLHILEEDATTIVFPRIIGQLSEDMSTVAQRLAVFKTGAITQNIEQEIVETLEQLLDAVQQMQQENERGGQSARGNQKKPEDEPLLPDSAELRLLKSSQVRVNERTDVIAQAYEAGEESRDDAAKAFQSVADRQKEAADVAREMRDREKIPQ